MGLADNPPKSDPNTGMPSNMPSGKAEIIRRNKSKVKSSAGISGNEKAGKNMSCAGSSCSGSTEDEGEE